jgi:hypothetical protein
MVFSDARMKSGPAERHDAGRNLQLGHHGRLAVPAHPGAVDGGCRASAIAVGAHVDLAAAFALQAHQAAPAGWPRRHLRGVGVGRALVVQHRLRHQRQVAAQVIARVGQRQRERQQREHAQQQVQQVPPPVHGPEAPPFVGHRPPVAEAHRAAVAGTQLGLDHFAIGRRRRMRPVRRQLQAELVADEQAHPLDRHVVRVDRGNLVEHAAHAVDLLRMPLGRRHGGPAHEEPCGPQARDQPRAQQVRLRAAGGVPGGEPQQRERQQPHQRRHPAAAAAHAARDLFGRFRALVQDVDLAAAVAGSRRSMRLPARTKRHAERPPRHPPGSPARRLRRASTERPVPAGAAREGGLRAGRSRSRE